MNSVDYDVVARIEELAAIDQRSQGLLDKASAVFTAMLTRPAEEIPEHLATQGQATWVSKLTAEFMEELHNVDMLLKRQLWALKEYGIISVVDDDDDDVDDDEHYDVDEHENEDDMNATINGTGNDTSLGISYLGGDVNTTGNGVDYGGGIQGRITLNNVGNNNTDENDEADYKENDLDPFEIEGIDNEGFPSALDEDLPNVNDADNEGIDGEEEKPPPYLDQDPRLGPNANGMIGKLDVGWLNCKERGLERQLEREAWAAARRALERQLNEQLAMSQPQAAENVPVIDLVGSSEI